MPRHGQRRTVFVQECPARVKNPGALKLINRPVKEAGGGGITLHDEARSIQDDDAFADGFENGLKPLFVGFRRTRHAAPDSWSAIAILYRR